MIYANDDFVGLKLLDVVNDIRYVVHCCLFSESKLN